MKKLLLNSIKSHGSKITLADPQGDEDFIFLIEVDSINCTSALSLSLFYSMLFCPMLFYSILSYELFHSVLFVDLCFAPLR